MTPPASIATLCSRGCLYLGPNPSGGRTVHFASLAQYAVRDDWRLESLPRLARWGSLGGTNMSNTVHLSDVQLLNLSVLMTIQASIKKGSGGRVLSVQPQGRPGATGRRLGPAAAASDRGKPRRRVVVQASRRFLAASRCPSRAAGSLVHRALRRDSGHRRRTQVNAPTRVGLMGKVRDAHPIRRAPHSFSVDCEDVCRAWRQNSHDQLHHRARAQRARPPFLRRQALRSPGSPSRFSGLVSPRRPI